ncbi:hypothetical protein, variant [Verruconis gallopava]|uniref:PHD-type domain-containing protein n=1 Tax=Verruconis gallopava TaxID=253628 RepID=A0A0D2ANN9_9PEZI|nr:hypothetical protein, variant [Verruconis gallopava]KIW08140.1 hypothetical protein, variant [Verruconis gallopava]
MDTASGASAPPNGSSNPSQPPPVAAIPVTSSTTPALTPTTTKTGNGSAPTTSTSSMPTFPTLSASTAELLARARASVAGSGTPGYEAAREQLMKSMVMSDKLPIPTTSTLPKRGRGGKKARGADGRSPSESTPGSVATPTSERGRGKTARGRGRGRGGGRGGKRKRSESLESDDDSDDSDDASHASASYTPLPKVTKSGRFVNKPSQYVPVIPEPASHPNKKKRPYRRNIDAAVCKMCHRPTSPTNNQIVFCDGCSTPYHQYCHDPPIENEVVEVQEKEWFCVECVKARAGLEKGDDEGLVSGERLSMDEKRSRLNALPHARLVEIVLRASSLQPTLALFPSTNPPAAPPATTAATATTSSAASSASLSATAAVTTHHTSEAAFHNGAGNAGDAEEPYDGYDTDPPAHYPKAGNGLARTLPPETEDLDWLVDENDDVFSHHVRPLSLGLNGGDVGMSGS